MADKTVQCDFCGCDMVWGVNEQALDASLQMRGFGLGCCCSDCDDKQIALFVEQEAADERRRLEDEEMERHFRDHPHG